MKMNILSLLLIFFITTATAQNNIIYYTSVEMPENLKQSYYGLFDTRLLAQDVADLLIKATGKNYLIKPWSKNAEKGIFLLLDPNGSYLNNEHGKLECNNNDVIKIKAKYVTGLSYSIYSWLQELGFHFYLPGEEWMIIPSLASVYKKTANNKSYKPYFKLRTFGGSGGSYLIKGLDEKMQNEKDWLLWNRRNRMGSDYMGIDGHIGEQFNLIHKKTIEQDPSILAPYEGKRQFKVDGKLDPTNKKGVALFGNWIANESKKSNNLLPSFLPAKKYFTADAGDGLNYCETPECNRQFRSQSDQAFSIVNEVAKKVNATDGNTGVSTLAYGVRTDTPSFTLEPNVHVQVVASAFQTITTTASLMKRWALKTKNLSQYDYLNIGVWVVDHPFFDLGQYHNYLKFLKQLNIDGLSFETSRSKFASGIQQYFIVQYLCDPYISIEAKLDEFCINNFGRAAPYIKELLKEWYFSTIHQGTNYDYPTFYADELGRFVKYITDAENVKDLKTDERKRIFELKAYTVFLCLMYEIRTDVVQGKIFNSYPSLQNQKGDELLNYTWFLYKTKIFQNTQLTEMLLIYLNNKTKEKWDYKVKDFKPFANADIEQTVQSYFSTISKKYLPLAYPLHIIDESFFEKNIRYSADSFNIASMDETAVPNYIYNIDFYCAAPGNLKIRYQTKLSQVPSVKKKNVAIVSVEKKDYSYIKTDDIKRENSNGMLTYQIPSRGYYKLYLSRFETTPVDFVIYPGKNLFYYNKKSIPMNLTVFQDQKEKNYYSNKHIALYVHNLQDIKFSYLYWSNINTLSFFSANGSPLMVNTKKQPGELSVSLSKKDQNNFVFYSNTQYRWPPVLLNTAPYYFFLKYPLPK